MHNYIYQDKPGASQTVVQRVFDAIDQLAIFPMMSRAGRVLHTRELIVSKTPLMIVYQVQDNTLFVVRILHTARKWP